MEARKENEYKLRNALEDKEAQYDAKIELLNEKIRQNEEMTDIYRDFVQKRKNFFDEKDESYIQMKEMSRRRKDSKDSNTIPIARFLDTAKQSRRSSSKWY